MSETLSRALPATSQPLPSALRSLIHQEWKDCRNSMSSGTYERLSKPDGQRVYKPGESVSAPFNRWLANRDSYTMPEEWTTEPTSMS